MRAWGFLRSRVMVASLGAVLIFGGGAALAVSQLTQHVAPGRQVNTASAATTATSASAAATATADAGSGVGAAATSAPTATTNSPAPTTPPPPPSAPTSVPAGQAIQIQGRVYSTSPNANSFTVQVGSKLYTVVVNASTTYPGDAKSLSAIRAGMDANVTGAGTADGSVLASSIDAQSPGL